MSKKGVAFLAMLLTLLLAACAAPATEQEAGSAPAGDGPVVTVYKPPT